MFGTNLHALDFGVIAGYLAVTLAIGVWFTRRASRNSAGYFLAGRSLPWWIAGTSIVATTFSSDTPLQVTGLVRAGGISENWWWWSFASGHVIAAFIFAPLWQRSGLTTDVQFIAARYEGVQARVLRAFDAVYSGLFVNSCVIAAVCVSMGKLIAVLCNIDSEATIDLGWFQIKTVFAIVTAIAALTIGYSLLSGLYGVAYTDFLQFILSMAGAIALAVIVVKHFGGMEAMLDQVRSSAAFRKNTLAFFPELSWRSAASFTFLVFVFVHWWSRAPGHGALAQRLLASRSQRDSVLAMLWFNIAHYCLRPWPWIIVGLASIAVFPEAGHEGAYPMMINAFLPVGLKGMMVVAMLSAFMSTVDTHVNLASAYLSNDLYRPLLRRERSERHYVLVGRLMMLPVLVLLIVIASRVKQIISVYQFLGLIMSGMGLVMVLRWLWWRMNAWSEIAALLSTVTVGITLSWIPALNVAPNQADGLLGHRIVINVLITTAVWLTVTLLTRPVSMNKLKAFYEHVRPPGPGWGPVALACPHVRPATLRSELLRVLLALAMIYSGIVGVGKLVLGEFVQAGIAAMILVPCAVGLGLSLRGLHAPPKRNLPAGE